MDVNSVHVGVDGHGVIRQVAGENAASRWSWTACAIKTMPMPMMMPLHA
jgi:hypothetical protein